MQAEDSSQSDPTMKYQHNSDAYNTYKSEGLPPGPLCSMNLNVIKACVEPGYFL